MRIKIKVQGEANGMALFDILQGRAVCWKEGNGNWHEITFDYENIESAQGYVADLFPDMKFHVCRA
jgi:hypothetical protein